MTKPEAFEERIPEVSYIPPPPCLFLFLIFQGKQENTQTIDYHDLDHDHVGSRPVQEHQQQVGLHDTDYSKAALYYYPLTTGSSKQEATIDRLPRV
jgi:hypothetical protein